MDTEFGFDMVRRPGDSSSYPMLPLEVEDVVCRSGPGGAAGHRPSRSGDPRLGAPDDHGDPPRRARPRGRDLGRRNRWRSRSVAGRRWQPSKWSFTRPIACMKAYTVLGPTNIQPRRRRSRLIALDSGLWASWSRVG